MEKSNFILILHEKVKPTNIYKRGYYIDKYILFQEINNKFYFTSV